MLFEILSTCRGGGYQYCRTEPRHPRANAKGLYPLHRVLAENKIGRLLEKHEIVHHKDEDKDNNDPSNLEVMTRAEHSRLHMENTPIEHECAVCGTEFKLSTSVSRQRLRRSKYGKLFCSKSCGTKHRHQVESKNRG